MSHVIELKEIDFCHRGGLHEFNCAARSGHELAAHQTMAQELYLWTQPNWDAWQCIFFSGKSGNASKVSLNNDQMVRYGLTMNTSSTVIESSSIVSKNIQQAAPNIQICRSNLLLNVLCNGHNHLLILNARNMIDQIGIGHVTCSAIRYSRALREE